MKGRLPVYTIMHFLVDLLCIYRIYTWIMPLSTSYENWIVLVVLYNFLAFALPALVGLIADYKNLCDSMASLGCLLVALPTCMIGAPIPSVIAQGIGNGLFHVGVGRRVLLESDGKYAPSGIFISSGAMGVFLGTIWRKYAAGSLHLSLTMLVLLCAGILLCFSIRKRKKTINKQPLEKMQTSTQNTMLPLEKMQTFNQNTTLQGPSAPELQTTQKFLTLPVCMLLLVVVIRSFYGYAVHYDWKAVFINSFLFACCIVLGKALGGIVADRIGVRATSVLSLGGAALTVLFSENSPMLGCISILLFNMTMPLTLSLLAKCWKDYPGFAFGSLMLAIFIGTIPDLIGKGTGLPVWGLCLVSVVSLLCLLIGIGGRGKGEV